MDQIGLGSGARRHGRPGEVALMVQRKIGLTIFAIILACRGTIALAQPADATPGEKHAYAFRALTVQVRSYTPQDPREPKENGYGFIVGKTGDLLTIVTADHVV